MSNKIFSELTSADNVKAAVKKGEGKAFSAVCGALATIEEPTSRVDVRGESDQGRAAHYRRALMGEERKNLKDKDFQKIAELVKSFIVGPKRTVRTSPKPKTKETAMKKASTNRFENYELIEFNGYHIKVAAVEYPITLGFDTGGASLAGLVNYALTVGVTDPELVGTIREAAPSIPGNDAMELAANAGDLEEDARTEVMNFLKDTGRLGPSFEGEGSLLLGLKSVESVPVYVGSSPAVEVNFANLDEWFGISQRLFEDVLAAELESKDPVQLVKDI